MIQITLSGVDALKKALSTEQVESGLQEVYVLMAQNCSLK